MWSRLVRMSVVMDYIYADVYQFDKNVYVANDEVIIGSSIEVNDSLVLKNNGFINVGSKSGRRSKKLRIRG